MTPTHNDASAAPPRVSSPRDQREPVVLRGAAAISAHLGMAVDHVEQLHASRAIPTFALHGEVCATVAGLDEWAAIVCLVFRA